MLIDQYDVGGPAEAIVSILGDPQLRRESAGKGRRRARESSWEETARKTLQVYEEVLDDLKGKRSMG